MVAFLTEPVPVYGRVLEAARGVARLVAPNPGPMTYHGTNTWLVEEDAGTAVIDPGPDDGAHVAAILNACSTPSRILLTHTHPDHVGAALALQAATGAAIHGWHAPWLAGFVPDVALRQGDVVGQLTVLHTPGHASDHVCFARGDGVVFTGDHVMSWSTSVVSPPDGDMAAYMEGLRRLLERDDRLYLCGHGPPLPEPASMVRAMLVHRAGRENAILAALGHGERTPEALVAALYPGLAPHLAPAAARSVLAHLGKLADEGRVCERRGVWLAGSASF